MPFVSGRHSRFMTWAAVAALVAAPAVAVVGPADAAEDAGARVTVVDQRRVGPARGDRTAYDFLLAPGGLLTSQLTGSSTVLARTRLAYPGGVPRAGRSAREAVSEPGWAMIDNASGTRLAVARTAYVGREGVRLTDRRRTTGRVPQRRVSAGNVQGVLSGPYLYLASSERNALVVGPHAGKVGRFTWDTNPDAQDFLGPWWARVSGPRAVVRNVRTGATRSVTPPVEALRTVSGVTYDVDRVSFDRVQILGRYLLLHGGPGGPYGGNPACPAAMPDGCTDEEALWRLDVVVNWRSGKVVTVAGRPGTLRVEPLLVEGGLVVARQVFDPVRTVLSYVPHGSDEEVAFTTQRGTAYPRGMQNRSLLLTPESRTARAKLVTVGKRSMAPQHARLLGTWGARWRPAKWSWSAELDFTQALDRWVLRIENRAGAPVRVLRGRAPLGSVRPTWNGRNSKGRKVRKGVYRWALTGRTAGGGRVVDTLDGAVGGRIRVS